MVKSNETERFWSHVDRTTDCWNWTLSLNHGYGQFWFGGKRWIASRLAWTLTFGPIPFDQFVCHRCDNPKCVRPEHLFLADQFANLLDMRAKKRGFSFPVRRGVFNNKTDMSDDDVREVRRRYASGEGYRPIARDYGVWHTTIASIVKRKTWRHIT